MFKVTSAALALALLTASTSAHQAQGPHAKPRSSVITKKANTPASPAACKNLSELSQAMDSLYASGALKDILEAIDRQFWTTPLKLSVNGPDSTWDTLIDCANETHNGTERAEALRVAAMWEHWRADTLQSAHLDSNPLPADSCANLGAFDSSIAAAKPNADAMDVYRMPAQLRQFELPLAKCADESEKLNRGKPAPEFARAYKDLWMLNTFRDLSERNARLTAAAPVVQAPQPDAPSWVRNALSDTSDLIVLDSQDRLGSEMLALVAEHNHRLCDQIITVAGLTPEGLALYMPPEGQQFMAKNAEKYPRMCLLQDASRYAPGVPRYLLVWAYSENAFAGFQPVQQITTAPVSGTGTATNLSGEQWNFTYRGTETEIETLDAPYVVQSRSLYLRAYDETGNVISQHSITTSRMAGGDTSYAAGYNAGALISALWNNPSRLIRSALKDVQRDSMKQPRER